MLSPYKAADMLQDIKEVYQASWYTSQTFEFETVKWFGMVSHLGTTQDIFVPFWTLVVEKRKC